MSRARSNGLAVSRRFTTAGDDPFSSFTFVHRDARITNPDGSVVFEMRDVEVPDTWGQTAVDVLASKYFRKAGVPQFGGDGKPLTTSDGSPVLGAERSARQWASRIAGAWRVWGDRGGYFASDADAQAFEDECAYILMAQIASPNSPQHFNTGLFEAYGIVNDPNGEWYVDPATGETRESAHRYERVAANACFPAGTLVDTDQGHLPIEKVEPGVQVLTHQGRWRAVSAVMQRQCGDPLVNLSFDKLSALPVSVTAEHPFYALRSSEVRAHRHAGHEVTPSWVEAGDLEPGDFVVIGGFPASEELPADVDLATYVTGVPHFRAEGDQLHSLYAGRSYRRFVSFADPSIMRLVGRWLGDGSTSRQSVGAGNLAGIRFTFNSDEDAAVADVVDLMERHFGLTATREDAAGQNTSHLRFGCRPLAEFFVTEFGSGFAGKFLPDWVFQLPTEHVRQLLVGLWGSDGCIGRDRDLVGAFHFDHSNSDLAYGVWRLLVRLGVAPSLSGGKVRPGGTVPHYRISVQADSAEFLWDVAGISQSDVRIHTSTPGSARVGDLLLYRVSTVGREDFDGTVYNFSVADDESYTVNGLVVHNCFIQSVGDQLVGDGSIFDLMEREARLFQGGSGSGTNYSAIRAKGEKLSGGGTASGVMSFIKVSDRAAGGIKSGGTTRRAAKMVLLDADHPEVEDFVWAKAREERKIAALAAAGWDAAWNAEDGAVEAAFYQNFNASVMLPEGFMQAVRDDAQWDLTARTTGEVVRTVRARELWEQIAQAAWQCADPGVMFSDVINSWNTVRDADGEIVGTNPCAEFVFVNDTACNLASINLVKFWDDATRTFDHEGFEHVVRLFTVMLEITVTMSHYPSAVIARNSFEHRPLGLGFANLGALLMRAGLPYDSDEGRAAMSAISGLMTLRGYTTSTEMAAAVGPCISYGRNRGSATRVLRNHVRAAHGDRLGDADSGLFPLGDFEGLTVRPEGIRHQVLATTPFAALSGPVLAAGDELLRGVELHGLRNMQLTVVAPTGTIGLQMSADTTGVEPSFATVIGKKLAGGGYMKIVNESVAPALAGLGYTPEQVTEIVAHALGTGSLDGTTAVNRTSLLAAGLPAAAVDNLAASLPSSFDLRFAADPFVVGTEHLEAMGITEQEYTAPGFSLLEHLGFPAAAVEESSKVICGHHTVEGAPHLRDEHLAVFDCANYCGDGTRTIHWSGHVRALGAVAPFVSGSISKTVNLPNDATVGDIEEAHTLAYDLGVKNVAIYRDGSKGSQVLSSGSLRDTAEDAELADEVALDVDALVAEAVEEALRATRVIDAGVSPTQFYKDTTPPRFKLPTMVYGPEWRLNIGGQKIFLRAAEYPDGSLGEIWIEVAKEGSLTKGLASCLAIAVSQGLQHGVPLTKFVDTFTFHTFAPNGMVQGHDQVKMANSLVDLVFRVLGYHYLGRTDLVQVKPENGELVSPAGPAARSP